MIKSVYLSPSTQEKNIGFDDYGTEEDRMNQVCDVVQEELLRHGIMVFRNRPDMTLKQVVEDSNRKEPTIHFAIHSNAHTGKTRGSEVFCHRFGGEGERLARLVYEELEPLTPTKDRGVKEGLNHFGQGIPLYELANTTAPAVLMEIAFHDNPEDAKWILANIEPVGIALSKGILNYFVVPYIEEDKELDEAVDVLVSVGFINTPQYWKDNAVKGKTTNGEYAGFLIKRIAAYIKKLGIIALPNNELPAE
ncbi:MAG: N-acetylmuramoyl-L-alanine amidase [Thermoclostridium sp.]|nr:N-acetylmuramoyl-L-alanine amidase [Thermoclostridium sp.]